MSQEKNVSLLWPHPSYKEKYGDNVNLNDRAVTDLGIEQIVRVLSIDYKYAGQTKQLLLNLCNDEEVIKYRLDVMDDFARIPGLASEIEKALPSIRKLESYKDKKTMFGAEQLRKIAWQLEILDVFRECVTSLYTTLHTHFASIRSEALKRLHQLLEEITNGDTYKSLQAELPEFRTKLQSMSSVTIGINLDFELKPAEAIFLSVEPKPFKSRKRSLVSSLLGLKSVEDELEGVSLFQNVMKIDHSPLEQALFKCLEEVFQATIIPIGQALQKYINVSIQSITELEFEIAFFVGAYKLMNKLKIAGLAICKPETAPKEGTFFRVEGLVDVLLSYGYIQKLPDVSLGNAIVGNDVDFGTGGTVFILTGPNQGGKTTYTRAIGLSQVLFQAGLFVPGRTAYISPVDWIFTHFSEEEKPNMDNGRLGDESLKLSEIFTNATPHSLLLLNESLSSTSPRDSYYLARDLVKGIKLIGCRTVFATHILELAAGVDKINEETPAGSELISMVAGVELDKEPESPNDLSSAKRTYKVFPGPPIGKSFAHDIARKHGISFEQIVQRLKERQIIDQNQ